jgi:MoaA/NifB/PqqE/SkfB family radical SAM enzyme
MVDEAGGLVISRSALDRAGMGPADDVLCEFGPDGLRLTADRLRKVYVEPTSRCNLDCAMCVRHGWQEPEGDMPLERYARLLDGLPSVGPDRLTLAFSGFGEPLAEAVWGRGLTYPAPSVDEAAWRNRCRFAHEGMCAVSWDGRVTPCLSLLHSHAEHINSQARSVHAYVVGHIDERPLSAIWRDPSFREFRQRARAFDFPPCFHCGGCPFTETNDEDCYRNPAPVCGECLWAQGIVLCP